MLFLLVSVTTCAADQPTPAPTSPPTTASPTTTAGPTPTLPTPTTGSYNVTSGVNGSVCLLASFGLRIGVKQGGVCASANLGGPVDDQMIYFPPTNLRFLPYGLEIRGAELGT